MASSIERIWIFEGKTGRSFPEEKKILVKHLSRAFTFEHKPSTKTSLAISLAGDGSLLSMVRNLGELRHAIPILGIHTSPGLGFLHKLAMPSTEASHKKELARWMDSLIESLRSESFTLEKRWGVQAERTRHPLCWGMNDLVISKGSLSRMVSIKLKVNGTVLFAKLRGDGLIIASPTGSTAYSLAAGGPIVVPGIEGMIMTPILPHEIAQRPVVLSADSILDLEILDGPPCYITEDGQRTTELHAGQSLRVNRSDKPVLWLSPQMDDVRDYFELLRTKLGLGGDKGARYNKG